MKDLIAGLQKCDPDSKVSCGGIIPSGPMPTTNNGITKIEQGVYSREASEAFSRMHKLVLDAHEKGDVSLLEEALDYASKVESALDQ